MGILQKLVSATHSAPAARALELVQYVIAAAWLCAAVVAYALTAATFGVFDAATVPGLVGAIVLGALGVSLFAEWGELYGQHARDLMAQAIFESVRRGKPDSAYSLYLRPFVSTDAISETQLAPAGGVGLGALSSERFELEAQIERAVRSIGPLIALGAPLEHIGAGRVAVSEGQWREAIRLLMSNASLIIMLPSSRAGTLEEIAMILDSDLISRTIIVDPPNLASARRFDQAHEWAAVQGAFVKYGFELPDDSHSGMLVYFGRGRKPQLREHLDIDAEDRVARLFRRVAKTIGTALAA